MNFLPHPPPPFLARYPHSYTKLYQKNELIPQYTFFGLSYIPSPSLPRANYLGQPCTFFGLLLLMENHLSRPFTTHPNNTLTLYPLVVT